MLSPKEWEISWLTPTNAWLQVCVRDRLGSHTACQEVDSCHTRGESKGMCNTYASTMHNQGIITLTLKSRGDITRSPKQGCQWLKEFYIKILVFDPNINTTCLSLIYYVLFQHFAIILRHRIVTHMLRFPKAPSIILQLEYPWYQ